MRTGKKGTKKRAKRTIRKKSNRVELVLKALSELYRADRLSPGLVLSWLNDKQQFYCSLRRYPKDAVLISEGVLYMGYGETVEEAMNAAIEKLKDNTKDLIAHLKAMQIATV